MLFSKSFVVAFGAQAVTLPLLPRAEATKQDEAWCVTYRALQSSVFHAHLNHKKIAKRDNAVEQNEVWKISKRAEQD
ncbi:hypothetical protein ST47_g1744 [Ascochyta rabiei]|uniref:Uncharacterized protein n=1 Tax=Didymella rabiei TaxID=5454 RepID=A0A163KMQ8_DIDRA|nr:hypothetical protein ST47_g1744 [Ascochyta rabiei]